MPLNAINQPNYLPKAEARIIGFIRLPRVFGVSPHGVMVKSINCGIIESEFEL